MKAEANTLRLISRSMSIWQVGSFLVIFLFGLFTGIGAIYQNSRSQETFEYVRIQHVEALNRLVEVERALWELRFDLPNYLAEGRAKRPEIKSRFSKYFEIVSRNLQFYAHTIDSEEELTAYLKFVEVFSQYKFLRPNYFNLIDEGREEEAVIYRLKYTKPLASQAIAELAKLIEYQEQDSKRVEREVVSQLASAKKMLILFLIVETFLLLWLVRSSIRSLKKNFSNNLIMIQNSKMASLGEMSSGVAHEINNPLAIIEGAIRLMPNYLTDPEKLASKLEVIKKSCGRISKIVSGLQRFSRSGGTVDYSLASLDAIIREVLTITDSKARRHQVPVTMTCDSKFVIFCNEIEIEQVLINLVNNGIDAVKSDRTKWIKIDVNEEPDSYLMSVIDSGTGIHHSVQQKIFEPFFTTKNQGEGTGLGLSISRGILSDHKATISVAEDCPNTCFHIRFPKPKSMTQEAA